MATAKGDSFDSEELLHLALHAVDKDESEKAITHLKKLLEVEPTHATARYLLGAVRAGLGMYERAIADMREALDIDPNLPPTAPFQLGLLYLTSGQLNEAREAWKTLDPLGDEDPLFLFKRGMLHLAADEFDACIDDLQRGISLNDANAQLNHDMQGIIERAVAARAAQTAAPGAAAGEEPRKRARTRLSAYDSANDAAEDGAD